MAEIFDKITGGINKGVATVGIGSKNLMGKAKAKAVISNLEKECKEKAEKLGMLLYKRFIASGDIPDDEEIAAIVADITGCLEGIAQQEAEIKRMEEEAAQVIGEKSAPISNTQIRPAAGASKICSCGFENEATAKFCASCGSEIKTAGKGCASCSFENETTAKFCASCGNGLEW